MSNWSRRDALRILGLTAASFPLSSWATNEKGERIILPDNPYHRPLAKAVTAITLGAGSRGNVYGNYAVQYPDQLDIIGVAEPIALRTNVMLKNTILPMLTVSKHGKTYLKNQNLQTL